jgi:ABC-type sugar transport system ATPase subunit
MADQAARLIEEHGFPLQADWRVERLSPAGKQLVEICRAIQHGSSLLIFDEPTSSLSESESQAVFRIVGALRDRKMGVIYITHRLQELRSVGDRVTILRDGETVHTGPLAGLGMSLSKSIQKISSLRNLPSKSRSYLPSSTRTREGRSSGTSISLSRRTTRERIRPSK